MNLDLQKVLPAEAFETEQNEGDYIGKDGLLYCGKCHTPKEAYFPEGKELFASVGFYRRQGDDRSMYL